MTRKAIYIWASVIGIILLIVFLLKVGIFSETVKLKHIANARIEPPVSDYQQDEITWLCMKGSDLKELLSDKFDMWYDFPSRMEWYRLHLNNAEFIKDDSIYYLGLGNRIISINYYKDTCGPASKTCWSHSSFTIDTDNNTVMIYEGDVFMREFE